MHLIVFQLFTRLFCPETTTADTVCACCRCVGPYFSRECYGPTNCRWYCARSVMSLSPSPSRSKHSQPMSSPAAGPNCLVGCCFVCWLAVPPDTRAASQPTNQPALGGKLVSSVPNGSVAYYLLGVWGLGRTMVRYRKATGSCSSWP